MFNAVAVSMTSGAPIKLHWKRVVKFPKSIRKQSCKAYPTGIPSHVLGHPPGQHKNIFEPLRILGVQYRL